MSPSGAADVFAAVLAADVDEDVVRALAERERRYVVYYALDHERVSIDELGDVVAGWVAANEGRVMVPPDRESLVIDLYHNHIPRLADAGLVEFDETTQVVTAVSLPGAVRDLVQLTYMAEHRDCPRSDE